MKLFTYYSVNLMCVELVGLFSMPTTIFKKLDFFGATETKMSATYEMTYETGDKVMATKLHGEIKRTNEPIPCQSWFLFV